MSDERGQAGQGLEGVPAGRRSSHDYRLTRLETHITSLEDSINEKRIKPLETWRDEVETALDGERRARVRLLLDNLNTWRGIAIALVTALGLGGTAGLWTLFGNINDKVKEVKGTVDVQLQQVVNKHMLESKAFKQAEDSIRQDLEQELANDSLFGISTVLSNVKLTLERREDEPTQTGKLRDLKQLRELVYEADWLLETYVPLLTGGKVKAPRRLALLYLAQGLMSRARGYDEKAVEWYDLAHSTDGRLVEPLTFKAQLYAQRLNYQGGGKWGVRPLEGADEGNVAVRKDPGPTRDKIIALYEEAYGGKIEPAAPRKPRLNAELRRSLSQYFWARQDFPNAALEAQAELAREKAENGVGEAQTYFRLGRYYWDWTRNETHPTAHRTAAIANMLEAARRDPDYLKALNNYLWYTTHTIDATDSIRPIPADQARAIVPWIKVFENKPGVQADSGMTDTLSETYYALALGSASAPGFQKGKTPATGDPTVYNVWMSQAKQSAKRAVELRRLDQPDAPDDDFVIRRCQQLTKDGRIDK